MDALPLEQEAPEYARHFRAIFMELKVIAEKRNWLLHSAIGVSGRTGEPALISLDRRVHEDFAGDLNVNMLNDLGDQAHALTMKILALPAHLALFASTPEDLAE